MMPSAECDLFAFLYAFLRGSAGIGGQAEATADGIYVRLLGVWLQHVQMRLH